MECYENLVQIEDELGAHNYKPLEVVITRGEGVWVWDEEGRKYLDCLSAYSAVNQGHCHPRIMKAMMAQSSRLTLTSRAFRNDQLGLLYKEIRALIKYHKILPMNSGAEAVESAIKAVRKWGYNVKGVPADQAEIIVCENNFHGRTITIVSFSTDPTARGGFGPFTPGFKSIPFGDSAALEAAITPNTVGFLVEPIQGEAGVIIPPEGYLREVKEICNRHNVALIFDEIQTGLGRTGKLLADRHENAEPDVTLIGKALSGGFYPISAVLSNSEVLGVLRPGEHGSTFGGNPLACAVARMALRVLVEEGMVENSAEMGQYFLQGLEQIASPLIK
ncbi:MAG: ornithine--oxo-acid transaminase, partial [Deltaproteobacteria bacterium]|nr:ornithine--oxo-acid transaminase [Deltaproteobacteria bacterium]